MQNEWQSRMNENLEINCDVLQHLRLSEMYELLWSLKLSFGESFLDSNIFT